MIRRLPISHVPQAVGSLAASAPAGHSAVRTVLAGQGLRDLVYRRRGPDAVGADFAANADPIVKTTLQGCAMT